MIDHQVIEEQAKKIMDEFLKELGEISQEEHFGLERDEQMRTPKKIQPNPGFRQAFFANAPKINDGLLQAERKQW